MKILLYVNSHLPQIGGRELVVHNLALQFIAKGHEAVLAGPAGFRGKSNVDYGYPVHRWPLLSMLPDMSRMTALAAFSLFNRFDVIHAHSTYPCGYIAHRLRHLLRTPLVITPHGEDINVVPEIGFGQRLDPVQKRKIEEAVRGADATTAISDTIAASLTDAGVQPDTILRIPNGVDLQRFAGNRIGSTFARFQLPESAKIVVSIGNFHPRKGHRVLVDAVALARNKVPDIALVIVGRTSDEFCAEVERQGHAPYVKFAGTLPVPMPGSTAEDPLADLLRAAKLYVSSSIDEGAEGLSLALLEAMAAGACPVVTNISGNRDIVGHQREGMVVPPGNAGAMAETIAELLNNDHLVSEYAGNAMAKAGGYGWDKVADQYLKAYGDLARAYDHRRQGQA